MVHALSPTAQFGLNVFEGVRAYWNAADGQLYALRLDDHLQRLQDSCKLIGFICPYSPDEIKGFTRAIVEANGYRSDCALRITVFGDDEGTWSGAPRTAMFIAPVARDRTDLGRLTGRTACISSWQRINDATMPPRIKVGANYINGRYAHLQAQHDGYDLPLFLGSDRHLAEGAGACLFMVRKGVLATPRLTDSILESITRDTVIALARDIGMTVEERPIDRTELYLADEAFLCGTAAEITPLVQIDRFKIGSGAPGDLTIALLQRYHAVADGRDEAYPAWREGLLAG